MATDADLISLGGSAQAYASLEPLLKTIDMVRPHPENPRAGDTDAIIGSIRMNHVYRPVYAQVSTGHILAGNHTYAALMEMGATRIPVIWLDVDDTQARRILAVDNRAADLGRYDDGMLLDLLQAIDKAEGGLLGSGYIDEDLTALMAQLDDEARRPIGPAEFPEYDPDDLPTDYRCPSCGYEWSGPPSGISGRGKEKFARA